MDRGSTAGVKAGMAVINADGVVGKVTAAYPTVFPGPVDHAIRRFAAGVVSAKNRVEGILKGLGGRECGVDYIQSDEKVEVGRVVLHLRGRPHLPARLAGRAGEDGGRRQDVQGDRAGSQRPGAGHGRSAGGSRGRPPVDPGRSAGRRQRAACCRRPPPRQPEPAAGPAPAAPSGTEADRLLEQYRKPSRVSRGRLRR